MTNQPNDNGSSDEWLRTWKELNPTPLTDAEVVARIMVDFQAGAKVTELVPADFARNFERKLREDQRIIGEVIDRALTAEAKIDAFKTQITLERIDQGKQRDQLMVERDNALNALADSPDDDEAKEAAFDALVPGFRNTHHHMNSLKVGFDEGWHARAKVSAMQPLMAENETLKSALRVIVDSLAPSMSFWGEDLPDPVSIGYARGTAIRALEEVAND